METTVNNASEYRDLPLAMLTPSTTNPRRRFDEEFLKGMAESIRAHGVLTPLLVRPKNERFEIVFGEQRYRSAQIAEKTTVPTRIKEMTDAEVLEAQLVENLQRRDVHPMEEAQGFKALLDLDEPKYSVEQIAAKTGKSPAYIAQRLKLTELVPVAVDAFYAEEIGVGHALLLAKLPADKQEGALTACFQEEWSASRDRKAKRILLPVRTLQTWIEQNILLLLKDAPFDKKDAHLVAIAGGCVDCPKRTGHNKLLFTDLGKQDACTDPSCYQAKVDAHVAKTLAAKPKLVQISTAYNKPQEGSTALPRGKYVAIQEEKPKDKEQAQRPEYKVCKFTTEAIIAEGSGKGTTHKVCANPDCPIHHPKKESSRDDGKWRAEQERQRKQEAISRATGLRTLEAIGNAVPVRLMKRELLYLALMLAGKLDLPRTEIVAKLHHLSGTKETEPLSKTVQAYLRRAPEGTLGRLVMEMAVLLRMNSGQDSNRVLAEAAKEYNLSVDTIGATVRKEFAAREKAKAEKKAVAKAPPAKAAPTKLKKTA